MVRLRTVFGVSPRVFHALVSGSALAAASLLSREAAAQTVTIVEAGITRSKSNRPPEQQRFFINRDDCLNDDVYTFPATISGFTAGITLEIWVSEGSVDCSVLTNRSGATQQCWNVGSFTPGTTVTPSLAVKSRDIVGKHKAGGGPNSGTVADCNVTGGTDAPLPLTVFFIVSRGTEALATTPYTGIQYDLQGPPAVLNLRAGVGEGSLSLNWDNPNTTDIRAFNFYCDPPTSPVTGTKPENLPKTCEPAVNSSGAGGTASGASGSAGTTSAGTAGTTSTAGAAGATAAGAAGASAAGAAGAAGAATGGASGDGGAAGVSGNGGAGGGSGATGSAGEGGAAGFQGAPDFGGAAGDTGAAGTTTDTGGSSGSSGTSGTTGTSGSAGTSTLPACGTSDCATSVLIGGQVPDPRYFCGSVASIQNRSGTITNLPNNVIANVGVAAIDQVGNVGPLSKVVCAAPKPIDDFYKVYRREGGRAGGGYCSVDNVGRASTLAPFGLALGLCALRVLRRRSR